MRTSNGGPKEEYTKMLMRHLKMVLNDERTEKGEKIVGEQLKLATLGKDKKTLVDALYLTEMILEEQYWNEKKAIKTACYAFYKATQTKPALIEEIVDIDGFPDLPFLRRLASEQIKLYRSNNAVPSIVPKKRKTI